MYKIYKNISRSSYKIKAVSAYTNAYRKFSHYEDTNWENREPDQSPPLLKKCIKKKSSGSVKFLNKKAENYYKLGLVQCFNLARDKFREYKKIAYGPETFKKISNTEYEIKKKTSGINRNNVENEEVEVIKNAQPNFMNSKRSRVRYRISGSDTNDIYAKSVFDDIKQIKINSGNQINVDTTEVEPNKSEKVSINNRKISMEKISEYVEDNQDVLAKNYIIRRTLSSFADEIKKKENLLKQLTTKTLQMSFYYDRIKQNKFKNSTDFYDSSDTVEPIFEKKDAKRKKQNDFDLENVSYESPDIQLEDTFIYNANYSIPMGGRRSNKRFKFNTYKYDNNSKIIKASEVTENNVNEQETNSLSLEDPDVLSFQRAEETVQKIGEPEQLVKKINRKRSVISENVKKREESLRNQLFEFIINYCGNKIVLLNNIIKQMLYRNNYKKIIDKPNTLCNNKIVLSTMSLPKLKNIKENHDTKKYIRIFRYPFPKDNKTEKRNVNLRLDENEESDDRFSKYKISKDDKYLLENYTRIKDPKNKLVLLENFNKRTRLNQDKLKEYGDKIRAILMLDKQIKKLIENNKISEKVIPVSRLNKKLLMKKSKIVVTKSSEKFKSESLPILMLRTRNSFKLVEKSVTEKDLSARARKSVTNLSEIPKRKLVSIRDLIKENFNENDKTRLLDKNVKLRIDLNEKLDKKNEILKTNLLLEKKNEYTRTKDVLMDKINKELYGKRKLSLEHEKKISFVNIKKLCIMQKSKENSIPTSHSPRILYKIFSRKISGNNSGTDSKQKSNNLLLSANENYVENDKNLKLCDLNIVCANVNPEIDVKHDNRNDETLTNLNKVNDLGEKLSGTCDEHDSAHEESDSCQTDESEECDNDFDIVKEVPLAFPDIDNQRERFEDCYKSPEYYSYDQLSYYKVLEHLKKYRVPWEPPKNDEEC